MLSEKQILLAGRSEYPHEQEALAFIRQALPNSPTVLVWELVELVDPSSGRLHEIDALILGYRALYLVEIKSGPGVYSGDTVDWYRQALGEPARYMPPPYKLTNLKCKVLKSLLERRLSKGHVPWIQPLVFLSHEDTQLDFKNHGDQCVVTRRDFARAITHHEFPGADQQRLQPPIRQPQIRELTKALTHIGIRPSAGTLRVGAYELGEVLEQGSGFEDRLALHTENVKIKRRARCYLVPEQTSTERRQQLRRAANREAQLLEDVKGHPNILRISDYVADAPLGPTVLFDHFEGSRLDAFLRKEEDLPFSDRIELVAQIGRALDHCHRKEVHHGSLSPAAVLVARTEGELDCRLYNFQLGSSAQVSHTQHWSALAGEDWAVYQAPELRESPSSPGAQADLFSLGAVAYLILTGKPPAESALAADERLKREQSFDPRSIEDGMEARVAECIATATAWNTVNRFDDAGEFVEFLLEYATAPAPPAPELNPLEAKKGDVLGEFTVVRVLGQGASSRVLEVERGSDRRPFALKVALNADEDSRLREEASVLRALRHQRVVELFDSPVIGGRQCLLLALAGNETLQRRLKQEGLVSLDYAERFGEDLLLALEGLEDDEILHRDIKPANIGVGTVGKRAHHLMLFDFSLGYRLHQKQPERHAPSQLSIGTVAYRDPYLPNRGAWDFAADRWSAAVTLHEMLTGTRPSWAPEGASPRDPEAELVLAAERFDASVRDLLVRFFEKALQADASARHESATAMRNQWKQCFVASNAVEVPTAAASEASKEPETAASDATPLPSAPEPFDYALVSPMAPIGALPFSGRALNALDRAGITLASELARLPDNRLSAVRGVGKHVVQEVLQIKNQWLAAHTSPSPSGAGEAFFPGYYGKDAPVSLAALSPALTRTLLDAGLRSLGAVAAAPKNLVERLATRAAAKPNELRQCLLAEQAEEEQRAHPASLEGWLRALLPRSHKRSQHLLALLGVSGPLAGRTDVGIAEVAKALDMTPPNLYIALSKAKAEWAAHPGIDELRRSVRDLVQRSGGALEIEAGGARLSEVYPPRENLDEQLQAVPPARRVTVAGAAVLRIVGLLEKDHEGGLRWERLHSGKPWLLLDAEYLATLEKLGEAADELAQREPLAASGETLRTLQAAAEGSPLGRLSDERLTELAAEASRNAARSSRLELYPRGLSPTRALQLSSAALTGSLDPEQLQQRVKARYPEADPLPPRPELDELLRSYGLLWSEADGTFQRPEQRHASLLTQSASTLGSLPTSQRLIDPAHVAASDFEERIRIALERGHFRVLSIRTNATVDAALALRDRFKLKLVNLDHALAEAAAAAMSELRMKDDTVVHATDRNGPWSKDWPQLCKLMTRAAEVVLKQLMSETEPLLLVNPGLLARYGLSEFLRELLHQTRQRDDRAVFVLVPGPDTAGVPRINGQLPIPEVGIPDTLTVPSSWAKTLVKQAS